jgi:serine/threonine protein kinase
MSFDDYPTRAVGCPSREELAAFSGGRLTAGQLEGISRHLAGCARCETLLLEIADDSESIVKDLRRYLQSEPQAETPECRQMEARARAISVGAFAAGAPGDASARSAAPPVPRQVGQYRIGAPLGQGGMGSVYKAVHARLGREVALKVLPPGRTGDARALARFQREMQVIGRFNHRNLVRATDAGEADGVQYLAMDLVDGINLSEMVRRCGPLSPGDACELIRQAALGLQYVHEHGLVHRDIKPSNLMVSLDGEVKVLDLGLVLLFEGCLSPVELTASGQVMGTADYMAPEQWVDSHQVDIRADIYSLGCTLYKLLTGKAPFGGPEYGSVLKKMRAHAEAAVPPIPGLPNELQGVLDRMLAKAPAERFATPAEAAEALQRVGGPSDLPGLAGAARARGEPSVAEGQDSVPSPSLDTRALEKPAEATRDTYEPRPPRRRWLILAGGVAAAGMVAVALVLLWPTSHEEAPTPPPVRPKFNVWHPLLENAPAKLLWPDVARDSFLHWDPGKREVRVDSRSASLVSLGVGENPGYQIRLGLRQNPWVGETGVFVGYHKRTVQGQSFFSCQVIELRKDPDKRLFTMKRVLLSVRKGERGLPLVEAIPIASTPVEPPVEGREHSLEIIVRQHGVASISWEGKPVRELVELKAAFRPLLSGAGHTGPFGVYCNRSGCVFGSGWFMLFEKEPP